MHRSKNKKEKKSPHLIPHLYDWKVWNSALLCAAVVKPSSLCELVFLLTAAHLKQHSTSGLPETHPALVPLPHLPPEEGQKAQNYVSFSDKGSRNMAWFCFIG